MHWQNRNLSDYDYSFYVLFGVPFDRTSSFRAGSRWAPDAIRSATANFESYNSFFDIDISDVPAHDAGNFEAGALVDDVLDELYLDVLNIVDNGKIPVMMGGGTLTDIAMCESLCKTCRRGSRNRCTGCTF